MSAPTALEVHVEIYGATVLAGIAYLTARRGAVTTRFEYDRGYLTTPGSFDLSPHLPQCHHQRAAGSMCRQRP